jgi:hypothetical protein
VHDIPRVHINANDDTARIYPGCIRADGSGEVERRENTVAKLKSVSDACRIVVFSYDVAFGVIRSSET